jgi:hypothetical protein
VPRVYYIRIPGTQPTTTVRRRGLSQRTYAFPLVVQMMPQLGDDRLRRLLEMAR